MATVDDLIQGQIDLLDEAIEKVERRLEKYDVLREKRDRLRSARRALTGGTRLTGAGTVRIRQEDIVEWLRSHPGSTLSEISDSVGGTSTQVSSHLNRGRNERFLNHDRRWWVRDPKNGLNDVEDIKAAISRTDIEEEDMDD